MKNSELLKMDDHQAKLLGPYEKQERYLLRIYVVRRPCPVCGTHCNHFEASDIAIDDYDVKGGNDPTFHCTKCRATLLWSVPLMGPPYWRRDFNADGDGEP